MFWCHASLRPGNHRNSAQNQRIELVEDARPRRLLRERILGCFVLFQLIAFPLGSYIKLVPIRFPEHRGELNGELQMRLADNQPVSEPRQTILDATALTLMRWGELTGQSQCWALFATFGVQAAMPSVELQWKDRDPVVLRCYFEPNDPSRYFYPPEPCCRLFNYEYRTVVYYWACKPSDITSNPEMHRREAMRTASDQRRSTTTYLRWKFEKYREQNPSMPMPDSIVLSARILPDPPAGAARSERPPTFEVPIARWTPRDDSYEVWDPISKHFTTEVP